MSSQPEPNDPDLEDALGSIAHDLANAAMTLEAAAYKPDAGSLPALVADSATLLFEVCGALDALIASLGDPAAK